MMFDLLEDMLLVWSLLTWVLLAPDQPIEEEE
jgi:hypothetical protein